MYARARRCCALLGELQTAVRTLPSIVRIAPIVSLVSLGMRGATADSGAGTFDLERILAEALTTDSVQKMVKQKFP